jgi:hypothetical protein
MGRTDRVFSPSLMGRGAAKRWRGRSRRDRWAIRRGRPGDAGGPLFPFRLQASRSPLLIGEEAEWLTRAPRSARSWAISSWPGEGRLRLRHAFAPDRPGTGPTRRQHHGLLSRSSTRAPRRKKRAPPCRPSSRSTRTSRSPSSPRPRPATHYIKQATGLKSGAKLTGPRSRRQDHAHATARDRRKEDEGSERQRPRGGDQDHRRLRRAMGLKIVEA